MKCEVLRIVRALSLGALLVVFVVSARAEEPPRSRGRGPNPELRADQAVFHELLRKHKEIRRTVKHLDNGVETLTESDNPEVAAKIQTHVASMHKRVKDGRGLRFWDDLFAAIFKTHAKITMTVENTPKGVRVRETSDDPYTVKLIQAHADVVSKFVEFGFDESPKNHPVPDDEPIRPKLIFPIISNIGGVAVLPNTVEPPRQAAKVVFDITADAKPGEVNKGLERVARLLNLYGASGMKASDIRVTVVLHGEATKSALRDDTFRQLFGAEKNPNLPVIRELRKAGVEVLVCSQALVTKGFPPSEIDANLALAFSALTVVINRQAGGYAVILIP